MWEISREIVYCSCYFLYEFNVDGFPISTTFYDLKYNAHDIISGLDASGKLHLAINEEGIKIVR